MSATPEQQATWDRLLLAAWKRNGTLFSAIQQFVMLENYELYKTGKFFDYVRELKLKRYPHPGEVMNYARRFIGKYCLKLSAYLLDGGDTEEALKVLDQFKWRQGVPLYTQDDTARSRGGLNGRLAKRESGRNERVVYAREIDKRHDWGTVK